MKPHKLRTISSSLVKSLEKKLNIYYPTDWHRITKQELVRVHKVPLDALFETLSQMYPEELSFDGLKKPAMKARQFKLKHVLQKIFPNKTIVEEKWFFSPTEKIRVEADLYIEEDGVVVEYQGEQHYRDLKGSFAPLEAMMVRDELKRRVFQELGLSMIEIPFWWDGTEIQIEEWIRERRPDLLGETSALASRTLHFQMQNYLATQDEACMEPMIWNGESNVDGYFITEKKDGIRAMYRDGLFVTKVGNTMHLPKFFVDRIRNFLPPDVSFDGEIFIADKTFAELNSLLRKGDNTDEKWKTIRFYIFDVISDDVIEKRYQLLDSLNNNCPEEIEIVQPQLCESNEHAKQILTKVTSRGGEGIILNKPFSYYIHGRSANQLKYKPILSQEVLFLQTTEKRYMILCMTAEGRELKVRMDSSMYHLAQTIFEPRKTVLEITFTQYRSNGLPMTPMVLRERIELSWTEIVNRYKENQVDNCHATPPRDLEEWFSRLSDPYPSLTERLEACKLFNLTKKQLVNWLRAKRRNLSFPGAMNSEVRSLIRTLQKEGVDIDIQEMSKQLKIRPEYLHNYVNQGVFNVENKRILNAYIGRDISDSEVEKLITETGLSKKQIQGYLQHHTEKGEFSRENKLLIENWMKEHADSEVDIEYLQKLTNLSRRQILSYLRRREDKNEELSQEKKEFLLQYIRNIPMEGELSLEELQELTNLSKKQISNFLVYHKNPKKRMTDEHRNYLTAWYNDLDTPRMPNEMEYLELKKETKLSRWQIRMFLYRLLHPNGEWTSEKRNYLINWLKDHRRMPTGEEYDNLVSATGLNRIQIHGFLHYRQKKELSRDIF